MEIDLNRIDNDSMLQKALNILEYMSMQKRRLSVQDIGHALNLPAATTHRIITDLKSRGYVDQHPDKSYFLTFKMMMIGAQAMERDNFLGTMLPYLNYFSKKYNCNVGLSTFGKKNNCHLFTVGLNYISHQPAFLPGRVHPLYCTGAGKVMLASMDDDKFEEWLSEKRLIPYTNRTIIDRAKLKKAVMETRERGYGIDVGEYLETIGCISVPITDETRKPIGGMNFTITVDRMDEINDPKVIGDIKDTLKELSVWRA